MALDDIIRGAVATANNLTQSLQAQVLHSSWQGQDPFGLVTYSAPVSRPALVEQRLRERQTTAGKLVMTRAKVTILDPSIIIDSRDKIVLPDGSSGPIVDTEGLVDPDTNKGYMVEIWIGAGTTGQ